MDLDTIKQQMRAMKSKVRAARKSDGQTQVREFQASAARLWRKARKLMPKKVAEKAD